MRKIKSKFKLDAKLTETMKKSEKAFSVEGSFIGAYRYKDHLIFHSLAQGLNYCSISREDRKKVSEDFIKEAAEHFIGKNYEIIPNATVNGMLHNVVNIWEVKLDA